MQSDNSIKKLTLNYAKCPLGDLHSGEVMNLICVDSGCGRRGIICPICRMKNHQGHEILPLKVFLQEIKKLFLETDDSSNLNNLSNYLRSIENSKKQILNILRETAQNIAQQFKALETKINENYTTIRRNVLTQSSISTKLPNLIRLLTEGTDKDALILQEEINKYSDLLKFQNAKMTVTDKAKKLVEEYSNKPNLIKKILNEEVKLIHQKFQQLLSNKSPSQKEPSAPKYTFSTQKKSFELTLTDDNKKISGKAELQNLGFAYIEQPGENDRKITFEVVDCYSSSISLGMGLPEKDQEFAFIYSQKIPERHFILNCTGYNNNPVYSESEEEDYSPDAFTFQQAGNQVTIHYEGDKNKITFSKKDSDEVKVIDLAISEEDKKKLQFCVVLGDSEVVRIVDG